MDLYLSLVGIFMMLIFSVSRGFNILYPLSAGLTVFVFLSFKRGHSIKSIISMIHKGISKTTQVYILLILIGASTALWMACGTIPFFIYYGVKVISPQFFVLSVFLITCLISSLIGSAFGTVGTIGVIFAMMAKAGNINVNLVAGAIIGAAHFGERSTPLSSSANLVSAVTGTSIYDYLKNTFKTTIIPLIMTLMLYALFSLRNPLNINFQITGNEILKYYNINLWIVLPALAILVFIALKTDVKAALLASIIIAFTEGVLIQSRTFGELLNYMLWGFKMDSAGSLSNIIHGGGISAMMKSILVVMVSSAYSGIFEGTNLLIDFERIIAAISNRLGLFITTAITSVLGACFGCSQTFSIIIASQFMKKLYAEKNADSSNLAVDIGNTSVVVSPLIPWSISSTFPAAVMAVSSGFIPYAFYLYLIPLFILFQTLLRNTKNQTLEV